MGVEIICIKAVLSLAGLAYLTGIKLGNIIASHGISGRLAGG